MTCYNDFEKMSSPVYIIKSLASLQLNCNWHSNTVFTSSVLNVHHNKMYRPRRETARRSVAHTQISSHIHRILCDRLTGWFGFNITYRTIAYIVTFKIYS